MIVVFGASGKTGSVVTDTLLDAGRKVRVVARDQAKLERFGARGAEIATGDASDPSFVTDALAGAEAAYLLVPDAMAADDVRAFQGRFTSAYAEGVRRNRVRRVVTLTGVGAHLNGGNGMLAGAYDMEQTFDAMPDVHTMHVRSTLFIENLFGLIGMALGLGFIGTTVRPDVAFGHAAAPDAGRVAGNVLAALEFEGKNHQYVLGARDYTFPEIARILGQAIGRPDLGYVQLDRDTARGGMLQGGWISPAGADAMLEYHAGVNDGRIFELARRTPENTSPTPVEAYAPAFAGAASKPAW